MNDLFEDVLKRISFIQKVGDYLTPAISMLQEDKDDYHFAKDVALIYARLRLEVYNKAIDGLESIKSLRPEIQDNPTIVLVTGKWGSEREEAKQELLNIKLHDTGPVKFTSQLTTCINEITQIFSNLALLPRTKESAQIGMHVSTIHVKLLELSIQYYEEHGIYQDLPEDSELVVQYENIQSMLKEAKSKIREE